MFWFDWWDNCVVVFVFWLCWYDNCVVVFVFWCYWWDICVVVFVFWCYLWDNFVWYQLPTPSVCHRANIRVPAGGALLQRYRFPNILA